VVKLLKLVGLIFCCLTVMSSLSLSVAQSEPQTDAAAVDTLQARTTSLQLAAELVDDLPASDLLDLRETVREIRQREEDAIAPQRARVVELTADRDRLAPQVEGVEEAPAIAQRRKDLQAEIGGLEAEIVKSDINIVEANRLLLDIAERRRQAFYNRIFERDEVPFRPSVLKTITGSFSSDLDAFSARVENWQADLREDGHFVSAIAMLLLSIVLAGFMLWPVPHWLDERVIARMQAQEPTPSRRVAAAGLRVLTRAMPALLGATLFYQVARAYGLVTPNTSTFVGSCLLALATLFVVWDVATAVFAPKLPQWRLIPLSSDRAHGVRLLIMLIVFVFSADAVLRRLAEWLGSSREILTLTSATVSVIGAVLLFVLARPQLWRLEAGGRETYSPETLRFWQWTRNLAGLFAIFVVLATVTGYVSLARFASTRLYFLAFLLTGAWFARALLFELAGWFERNAGARAASSTSAAISAAKDETGGSLLLWLRLLIDFVLVLLLLPLILLVFGVEQSDLRNWAADALFGFEIGGFTISIAALLKALGVLVAILLLTRLIQRIADKRVFEPTGMDSGLHNTLLTLMGYVGLIIAVASAFSVLGFPWANLALVAGALSLGIGFGLQSIVNNFVSGLILLFERPIKVGDWIVTSAGEGIVKNISVRSTEIETFDWASVIVPNSELVTTPVTNWTHKNRYTRLVVPIGVSYNSDPELVAKILMKCAKASPRVLSYPLPVVFFKDYGDSSLDFEVRIFINNVDDRIPVQNELRIAIFNALQAEGIEIPFPQRDVHVHTVQPGTVFTADPDPDPDADEAQGSGPHDPSKA
jgi:small-conductance mechanosensitive channel